jgi:hypothetical protein
MQASPDTVALRLPDIPLSRAIAHRRWRTRFHRVTGWILACADESHVMVHRNSCL